MSARRARARTPARRRWPARLAQADRRGALGVLALAALIVLGYLPVFSAGFVWDDVIFTESAAVASPSGLWTIWFEPRGIGREGHYWPIVYTTFWLEHKLWGFEPLGAHSINLALHFGNTLLVWALARWLSVPWAWFAAAVFAAHPLHVESVAWAMERKDLLSGMFYLGAALVYLRAARDAERAPRIGLLGAALALYALALLCKSIAATLPAALLVWHWWRGGRIAGRDALRVAPFFAVGGAIVLADWLFYQSIEPLALGYSLVERLLIAARALVFYAAKFVWPTALLPVYPHWPVGIGDWLGWAALAALLAAFAALWLARRRIGRGPLAGMLFFALTLSPVLGFVDYGYMQFAFVADRHQYLAGIGVLFVLAGAAAWGYARLPPLAARAAPLAAALALAALGTLTWRHARIYADELTFFTAMLDGNPTARSAHLNLGKALHAEARYGEALAAARTAIELQPESRDGYFNAGLALMALERWDEAADDLARAAAIDPTHFEAHFQAGSSLMSASRFAEAAEHFDAAWKLRPQHWAPAQNLAELHRRAGRFEDALPLYRAVIAAKPDLALAYAGLGDTLVRLGRYEESLAPLGKAIELAPGTPMARAMHGFLAQALSALGRPEESARHAARARGG